MKVCDDGLTAEITVCIPCWESAWRQSSREIIRNRDAIALHERSKIIARGEEHLLGYDDETKETWETVMFTIRRNMSYNLLSALWYDVVE